MKATIVLLVLLTSSASAQDSFRYKCPKGGLRVPASCLEEMSVGDTSRRLSDTERHQLAYLFAKSYLVSKRKYRQDYSVNPAAPIARLLVSNFPEVGKLETEGGIWLEAVFEFFRSQPGYKADVDRALREFPGRL